MTIIATPHSTRSLFFVSSVVKMSQNRHARKAGIPSSSVFGVQRPSWPTRLGKIHLLATALHVTSLPNTFSMNMETDAKPMSTKELTSAVTLLLEREEARIARQRKRNRRRVRRRRREMQANVERLSQSIEIIKWCIVGIASTMAIALLVLIWVVWQIGNEAERIKGEVEQIRGQAETMVEQIEHEADRIRDKIQHPLQSLGGALGGQLDKKLGTALGLEAE